ncbi:Peroxisomal adenine nucleotide transporter 1 [Grifola frondosa]|uniref:Peroxisomal adenine nucleotide transporter 1 n=1 Tax=Grifola frondosa TaxID=5627 RepID=A0A1C7LYQ5_GRIFR|nr:Peroxisomal adenine nucleotide transporter 1 [Grifola frondosa]
MRYFSCTSTSTPFCTHWPRADVPPLSIPTELVVGFVAGVASRAVSTPLSVVTVRLQAGEDDCDDSEDEETLGTIELTEKSSKPARMSGLMSVTRSIYAEEGLRGFWAGFAPTLPLCLAPTLTLLFFQLLRRIRLPISAPSTASPTAHFFSGASANALSLALLYPLLLAKVRVQAAHSGGGTKTSVSTVWAAAYKAHGWTGMYQAADRTCGGEDVPSPPTNLIPFCSYERVLQNQRRSDVLNKCDTARHWGGP